MSDADMFDAVTGEINGGTESVAARAQSVALAERAARRADDKGVGLVSLYKKLAKAYAKIAPIIGKDAAGNRGKFTSYAKLIEIVRPALLEQGILIRHGCDRIMSLTEGNTKSFWVPIFTDLIDSMTGEVLRTEMPMPIARVDPQAVGIAMSYGKRYTLIAAVAIATGDTTEDDDAEGAMPRKIDGAGPEQKLVRALLATKSDAEYIKWRSDADKDLQKLAPDAFDRIKDIAMAHREKLSEVDEPKAKK
jgi:hypothetical protein